MDHLWSPWRLAYVTSTASATGCVFCRDEHRTDSHLVLLTGRLAYVILNLYPYNNGHLMVVPRRHVDSLAGATAEELLELWRLTRDAEIALTEAYQPHGINVGVNLGRSAGAGIAEHLHIHLVPRWSGDTNFISVLGNTRVLPETLEDSARRLRPIFERLWRDGAPLA